MRHANTNTAAASAADSAQRNAVADRPVAREITAPRSCEPASVAPEDLLVAERHHPGRIGQIYRLRYNPAHEWVYFPRMRRDEGILFTVYDSARDGRPRFTPHTAFSDPHTPPGALPRKSMEIRTIAFF